MYLLPYYESKKALYKDYTTSGCLHINLYSNTQSNNMDSNNFAFGVSNTMREVPPGTEAIISFNGEPEVVETDWGNKYSFPILIHRHDSYPEIEKQPLEANWQSKSGGAIQLYEQLTKDVAGSKTLEAFKTELIEHYNNSKWQLTRFDTGTYFLTVLKDE